MTVLNIKMIGEFKKEIRNTPSSAGGFGSSGISNPWNT
jgi:hypothetical protein